MAVKTFTTGEVLTASDTNTYLANSGLVVVTPSSVTNGTLSGAAVTVGNAVSSVTVKGAFSTTYDNYLIQYNGGSGSVAQEIAFQFGPTSVTGYNTSYYGALLYVVYATGALGSGLSNNAAKWGHVGESGTNNNTCSFTVQNPFLSKYSTYWGGYPGSVGGWVSGYHAQAQSYTDFTLSVAGTLTGGTITVYGYRKG